MKVIINNERQLKSKRNYINVKIYVKNNDSINAKNTINTFKCHRWKIKNC